MRDIVVETEILLSVYLPLLFQPLRNRRFPLPHRLQTPCDRLGWLCHCLFAVVWVANVYVSFYAWFRQQYKTQKFEAKAVEHKVKTKIEPRIEIPPAA